MKKLFLSLVLILFFSSSVQSVTYNSNPEIFVNELIQDAIKTLSDKTLTTEKKNKAIEKIALENVDINALGLYSLGDLRKTLEPADLSKYQKLFEKYFLKSLTSRLTDYSSQRFEV